jgi:hypothetical protein
MTEELSSTINIVLVIFFIVAVVAIILMLIGIVKNMIGVGVMKFQGSASSIMDSQFDDYDQKIIGGVLVKNAVQQFKGQDVGVIVVTLADKAETGSTEPAKFGRNYDAVLSPNIGNDAFESAVTVKEDNHGSGTSKAPKGLGTEYYVNAQFEKPTGVDSHYQGIFAHKDGVIQYNHNTKPYNQSGYSAFIRDSAMYRASLILDPSGTKIGVYCEQVS